MSDQELFYLIMGIWAAGMVVITISAFWADAKINKRIKETERKLFEAKPPNGVQ